MRDSSTKAAPQTSRTPGTVYTFYSYKGGVGRSMALANVAALLAKWGRRVLVVDWDLEAPGLERYFLGQSTLPADARSKTPGMVDLIVANARGEQLDWRQCALKAELKSGGEPVSILTAGRAGAEYVKAVQGLDWAEMFERHSLGNYLDHMREEWRSEFDFILIDSRTGISDIGGICTMLFPEALVLFFTSNQQSIEGAAEVARRARAGLATLPIDRPKLTAVPVPARDERHSREYAKAQEWMETYAREFEELYRDWLPKGVSALDALKKIYIPYIASWSFGERLPVVEEEFAIDDPGSISAAYARLATLLDHRLDWSKLAVGAERHELEEAKYTAVLQTQKAAALEGELEQAKERAAEARRISRMRAWGGSAAVVGLLAWGAIANYRADVALKRTGAETLLAAATAADDPLLSRLLLREMKGLPEPPGGLERARELAAELAPESVLAGHSGAILRISFAADSTRVLTVSEDGSVRTWPADGRSDPQVFATAGFPFAAAFKADNKTVVAASQGDKSDVLSLNRFDPDADAPAQQRLTVAGILRDAQMSADGTVCMTSAERDDGQMNVELWSWASPDKPQQSAIGSSARFTGDGQHIVVTGDDQYQILDRSGATPRVLPRPRDEAGSKGSSAPSHEQRARAVFSDDARFSAVWTPAGPIQFEGTDGSAPRMSIPVPGAESANAIEAVALGAGAKTLVAVLEDGTVIGWTYPFHAPNASMSLPRGKVDFLMVTPLGLVVVGKQITPRPEQKSAQSSAPQRTPPSEAETFWIWPISGQLGSVVPTSVGPWSIDSPDTLVFIHRNTAVLDCMVCPFDTLFATAGADGIGRIWRIGPQHDVMEKDWETLTRYADESTTACLSVEQRVRLLNETRADAVAAHAECEKRFNRTPRRPDARGSGQSGEQGLPSAGK